jgi:hypothetical protein
MIKYLLDYLWIIYVTIFCKNYLKPSCCPRDVLWKGALKYNDLFCGSQYKNEVDRFVEAKAILF